MKERGIFSVDDTWPSAKFSLHFNLLKLPEKDEQDFSSEWESATESTICLTLRIWRELRQKRADITMGSILDWHLQNACVNRTLCFILFA